MKIDLVPAADHHAEALTQLVHAFVQEVGYYFGRTRGEDGAYVLPGLTDEPAVHPGRLVIERQGKPIGFLDWAQGAEEGGKALVALHVATGWRRRRVATQALGMLFTEHPGTWSLTVSPRFEPGLVFVQAILGRYAQPGTTTRRAFRRGKGTYNRVTFSAGTHDMALAPTGDLADFEFDRRHHHDRRRLLIGAIVCQILGGLLGLMAAAGGAPFLAVFLAWAAGAAALILALMYLERIVTSVLDRLDRGPIMRPHWMVQSERE